MDTVIQNRGAQVRDRDAVERLLHENKKLAYHFANKLGRRASGVEHDDMHQAALTGLARACQDWDPTRAALSTYAWHWARHEANKLVRGARRVTGDLTDDGELPDVAAHTVDLAERVDSRRLEKAVQRLAPRHHAAVVAGKSSTRAYVEALASLREIMAKPPEDEARRVARNAAVKMKRHAAREAQGRPVGKVGRPARKVAEG